MKISSLKDKFNSLNVINWSVDGTPSFSSSGVELASSYLHSKKAYELTGSGLFIELKSLSLPSENDEVEILDVDSGGGDWYVLGVKLVSGVQELFVYENNTSTYTYGATYNASVHKYFRIRELNTALYFEYSTDLKTWNDVIDPLETIYLDTSAVTLYIGTFYPGTSITLDNLNIPNTPVVGNKYSLPSFATS